MPDVLYVVVTNLPGPGASALVRAESVALQASGYVVGMVDELAAAADKGCEFVELETAAGEGRGPGTGVDWDDHPSGDLKRLGPFVALQEHEKTREALVRALELLDSDSYAADELDALRAVVAEPVA